ncbi:MAG: hemolysin family protein [Mycoplasmatales bacterium]
MESSVSSMIIFLIILFILSAIYSASEMAISSASRIRYKSRVEAGDKKSKKVLDLLENNDRSITSIVIINNIINILIPTIATIVFLDIIEDDSIAIITSTIFVTFFLILFSEITPKVYGIERSEQFLNVFTGFIRFSVKLIKPLSFLSLKCTDFLKENVFPKNDDSLSVEVEEEILTMIEESVEDGQLEVAEEELIRNAIEFNDIRVEEILQPKRNMIMININETKENILKTINEVRYSRIPIYENDTDNIIGVLSEREFLSNYIENKDVDIKTFLRDVIFIPDTMKISKLLPELQKSRSHMAIVVDERATVQGLVTVEDILEELVGEIWDEHDDVILEYKKLSDVKYEISGDMTINDFNDLFELKDIESTNSESTIAGYLLEIAERIPDVRDKFEDDSFEYIITKMDGNKIDTITTILKIEKEEK